MKMGMEHRLNDSDTAEPKYSQ